MSETRAAIVSGLAVVMIILTVAAAGCSNSASPTQSEDGIAQRTITDSSGRTVEIPSTITRSVCASGGTCVRYMAYLGVADTLVAVESDEHLNITSGSDSRPYVVANPRFVNLPSTGSSRDTSLNVEQVMSLKPQVIFSMSAVSNVSADGLSTVDVLQAKTGIPVISLQSGSFQTPEDKAQMYETHRILGKIFNNQEKAEKLIAYINQTIQDLENRTKDIPESQQKSAFIGGLSHGGYHGLLSTQSEYMPFVWTHVNNVATGSGIQNADFSKEGLVYANPDYIFIDAGTLGAITEIGGLEEIKSPVFADLKAVKNGNVYANLPNTYRGTNPDTQLVNAYFIGKTVYPDRFEDIDPKEKADEIFTMFDGMPVFDKVNVYCNNLAFGKVPLK